MGSNPAEGTIFGSEADWLKHLHHKERYVGSIPTATSIFWARSGFYLEVDLLEASMVAVTIQNRQKHKRHLKCPRSYLRSDRGTAICSLITAIDS